MEKAKHLENLIKKTGMNIKEWSVLHKIPYTTVRTVLIRGVDNSSMNTINKICTALNIKTSDLENEVTTFNFTNIQSITKQKLPLLGIVACGKPIMANEDWESYVEAGTQIKADFCLKVVGDSMINARINDGDIVFVRKQEMVINGEIAVVIIEDEATLKRVFYYPDSQKLVLQAENPKYEPLVYLGQELETIHILGKAIAFQSDVK